ncbi:hypothetical protein MTF65_03490 [Streptomyces sp. APSN-46.1]|uniref:hypothetical protein n=1 Tax=Streptomyces sp. APSN-46.1 TaxID=2929049 RepID=UPI001FB27464|nr:hypothetical protein [Streptomyces sp. APSN-46.1]MCJ1676428.1 hypothetical protein [Streptomyces sp. APSN-46.1]
MYRMCAEAMAGQSELLWHVLAHDSSAHTLCGRHVAGDGSALTGASAAADRYCLPCMSNFRSAVRERADLAQKQKSGASAGR